MPLPKIFKMPTPYILLWIREEIRRKENSPVIYAGSVSHKCGVAFLEPGYVFQFQRKVYCAIILIHIQHYVLMIYNYRRFFYSAQLTLPYYTDFLPCLYRYNHMFCYFTNGKQSGNQFIVRIKSACMHQKKIYLVLIFLKTLYTMI